MNAAAGTVELPMNAAMHSVLVTRAAKGRRTAALAGGVLGLVVFAVIVKAGVAQDDLGFAEILGLVLGLAVGAVVWGVGMLLARIGSGRQAHETSFLRSTGPLQVEKRTVRTTGTDADGRPQQESETQYLLLIADRRIVLSPAEYDTLSKAKVESGTVDYTKHNVLFEVKDDAGQSVYRRRGYEPGN